ncbi:MAG TPA: penicillin-binding protein activator LpoB [Candidatus Omnitrophota bacterium]|nr:penicillin-binding protein activator LpoB [Candidatus Omnitrophota bacterium]
MKNIIMILAAALIVSGCATKTTVINKENDPGQPVLSLDYRDFDYAVRELVDSLLSSGALRKDDGSRYIVTTGEIVNDTTQQIDTRQLMSAIEEQLIASGQVDMTSATGEPFDGMLMEVRDLRESDEFKKETLPEKRQLIAPELGFSGQIFQRIISYDKKTNQVEYYIELIVTNLKTGLRFWQKQVQILKRGSTKAPIW